MCHGHSRYSASTRRRAAIPCSTSFGQSGWFLVDSFASPRALVRAIRHRSCVHADATRAGSPSMNASHRIAARVGAVIAPFILAGALPAHASDWGCRVLLCLSSPGSPTEYSACVPPIELYSVLATGGGYSCRGRHVHLEDEHAALPVAGKLGAQAQPVTVRRQHLPVADRG